MIIMAHLKMSKMSSTYGCSCCNKMTYSFLVEIIFYFFNLVYERVITLKYKFYERSKTSNTQFVK